MCGDGDTVSMKPIIKRRKNSSGSKQLPPSKRLRCAAQRVLKERVQDIADKKGIRLRFCNLKECEGHIHALDSPCASIRMEIGWPAGVPFVHPHDLPNKAKLGFLEAYEPGWTASQQDMELSPFEPGQASLHLALIHVFLLHGCHPKVRLLFRALIFAIFFSSFSLKFGIM